MNRHLKPLVRPFGAFLIVCILLVMNHVEAGTTLVVDGDGNAELAIEIAPNLYETPTQTIGINPCR